MFLSFAAGALSSNDYSRTVHGWSARIIAILFMLQVAYRFGKKAWRITVAESDRWKAERETVQKWVETLSAPDLQPQVLQFNSESFWTGHFTYRMMNTGLCWVVENSRKAIFK